ncbi:hypothetical protein BsWGS_05235 [Bradybaena similaris]
MGRRGNMRARPGLLFIVIFAVCLVIVYFSWRSMMSPEIKVKDTYSMQVKSYFADSNKLRHTGVSHEEPEVDNHDRDPDYDIDDARQKMPPNVQSFDNEFSQMKPPNVPPFNNESPQRKNNFSNEVIQKSQPEEAKSSEKQADQKGFYLKPNSFVADTVKSMEQYVHLDLKGAPPKLSYLKDLIPLLKRLGATGLLIEYEDMFPYTDRLRFMSAKNAYSKESIRQILGTARANNLKVMPLIQTFGHMEFVLKSDSNKRESDYTPQVIDITKNSTYELISEMIKQILTAHPDATHLHIGCDEVYELGKGNSGIMMRSKNLTESQVFLQHVKRVSSIVRRHDGRDVVPVMWDDELRKTPLSDIVNSELPSLVEIMVWHYTKYVADVITNDVWDKYAKVFKSVWIATAFKGATGARQFYTEPRYHLENHYSWLDVIAANHGQLKFKGVALTGWQRYDHFATLCELLPVAIPSLAMCLATMKNAGFTEKIHMDTSRLLNCSKPTEISFPEIDKKTGRAVVSQDCRFTGYELFYAMQELYGITNGSPSIKYRLDGWLSDYQVAHNFTNPGQLRVLSTALGKQSSAYSSLSVPVKTHLARFYFEDIVDEWMDENIKEPQRRIEEQQAKIRSLLVYKSWPRRPLPVTRDVNKFSGTGNNNNYFLQGQVKNDANNQPVQQKFKNDAEFENKEYNQNTPRKNLPPPLHSQYQQNEDGAKANKPQQETFFNSKLQSANNRSITKQEDNNQGAGFELPRLPELKSLNEMKKEQISGGKKIDISFEDFKQKGNFADGQNANVDKFKDASNKLTFQNDLNKKENKADWNQDGFKDDDNKRGDLNQFTVKVDNNRKHNFVAQPDRYRPVGNNNLEIPELKDFRVNPQVDEDDRMRREKYLSGEKIDTLGDLNQAKLKKQKSAELGKFDGVFRPQESLKSQADKPGTLPDFRKDNDNSVYNLDLGGKPENNGLKKPPNRYV